MNLRTDDVAGNFRRRAGDSARLHAWLGYAVSPTVLTLLLLSIVLWIATGSLLALLYLLSYAYHFLNLNAVIGRRCQHEEYMVQSILFRTIAFLILAVLLVPYVLRESSSILPWISIIAGTVLHAWAVWALGLHATYFARELKRISSKQTFRAGFPYDWIPHPMASGAVLQFVGLYLLSPGFNEDYPYLLLGHIFLTVVTVLVEQFDFHFEDYFYHARSGRFTNGLEQDVIDKIRDWSLDYFQEDLKAAYSVHRYIKTLPPDIRTQIDAVRYADQLTEQIQQAFPKGRIFPMTMTDEIYLSRYNLDRGGDQGLFDKHYDGNLRFLPGISVVRSLIYLSSSDDLQLHFGTSGVRANMKTYDFGLLDFHKELHWVVGNYDPSKPPRILLKCNYLIDHVGIGSYRWICLNLNLAVFYSVRAAMEYSKSPKTIAQKCIGRLCNIFRRLNNVSPAIPIAVILFFAAFAVRFLVVFVS